MSIARMVWNVPPVSPKTVAPTTADSATVDPTERSMPLVKITRSWPIARIAIAALCCSTLPRLPVVKNTGDSTDITMTSTTRISSGPSLSTASSAPTSLRRAGLMSSPGVRATAPAKSGGAGCIAASLLNEVTVPRYSSYV